MEEDVTIVQDEQFDTTGDLADGDATAPGADDLELAFRSMGCQV